MKGGGNPSGIKFHLSESAWETLKSELDRLTEGKDAALVIALSLASSQGESKEEEEHKHVHLETPFVKSVKKFAKRVKDKYKAEPHLHLHPDSGSVAFILESSGEILIDNLKSIVIEASSCEGCFLTSVEGEVRVKEELSVIFYGSSSRLQFIMPSADGKKLQLLEVLLTF